MGLIAGRGRLPHEVARGARRRGRQIVTVAIRDLADPDLEKEVDSFAWLKLGELERTFQTFHEAGVGQVVMAGKVPKTMLLGDVSRLGLDGRALALIRDLADRKDDSILGAIADAIESEGFQLLPQLELAPELWAPEGPLGAVAATPAQLRDIEFGWPIAKTLGALDIGQTVVVGGRAVLALEAIEGTDAAIRRGCELARSGACVVKVAKPGQDPRFDVPAIGLDTVRVLIEAGGGAVGVEAGATAVLDREALICEADAHGVAVVGLRPRPGMAPEGSP